MNLLLSAEFQQSEKLTKHAVGESKVLNVEKKSFEV